MASYEIEITRTAEKQLRKLSAGDQLRVVKAIVGLADQPLPRGARKLTGHEDVYRIRVGTFRVLYSHSRKRLVILVLKIGHRREVCR